MNESSVESIRIRSEGALDLAQKEAAELRLLAFGVSNERWREFLPDLSAMGERLSELRAARDRLDALREHDGWPDDSSPALALRALVDGLFALEGAVAVRFKELGLELRTQKLEDAIAQLAARARATAPLQTEAAEFFAQVGLLGMLVGVMGLVSFWFVGTQQLLAAFCCLVIAGLSAWRAATLPCPRCGTPIGPSAVELIVVTFRQRCPRCGLRPR